MKKKRVSREQAEAPRCGSRIGVTESLRPQGGGAKRLSDTAFLLEKGQGSTKALMDRNAIPALEDIARHIRVFVGDASAVRAAPTAAKAVGAAPTEIETRGESRNNERDAALAWFSSLSAPERSLALATTDAEWCNLVAAMAARLRRQASSGIGLPRRPPGDEYCLQFSPSPHLPFPAALFAKGASIGGINRGNGSAAGAVARRRQLAALMVAATAAAGRNGGDGGGGGRASGTRASFGALWLPRRLCGLPAEQEACRILQAAATVRADGGSGVGGGNGAGDAPILVTFSEAFLSDVPAFVAAMDGASLGNFLRPPPLPPLPPATVSAAAPHQQPRTAGMAASCAAAAGAAAPAPRRAAAAGAAAGMAGDVWRQAWWLQRRDHCFLGAFLASRAEACLLQSFHRSRGARDAAAATTAATAAAAAAVAGVETSSADEKAPPPPGTRAAASQDIGIRADAEKPGVIADARRRRSCMEAVVSDLFAVRAYSSTLKPAHSAHSRYRKRCDVRNDESDASGAAPAVNAFKDGARCGGNRRDGGSGAGDGASADPATALDGHPPASAAAAAAAAAAAVLRRGRTPLELALYKGGDLEMGGLDWVSGRPPDALVALRAAVVLLGGDDGGGGGGASGGGSGVRWQARAVGGAAPRAGGGELSAEALLASPLARSGALCQLFREELCARLEDWRARRLEAELLAETAAAAAEAAAAADAAAQAAAAKRRRRAVQRQRVANAGAAGAAGECSADGSGNGSGGGGGVGDDDDCAGDGRSGNIRSGGENRAGNSGGADDSRDAENGDFGGTYGRMRCDQKRDGSVEKKSASGREELAAVAPASPAVDSLVEGLLTPDTLSNGRASSSSPAPRQGPVAPPLAPPRPAPPATAKAGAATRAGMAVSASVRPAAPECRNAGPPAAASGSRALPPARHSAPNPAGAAAGVAAASAKPSAAASAATEASGNAAPEQPQNGELSCKPRGRG
ncbi:unnamed protein product, partial [Phaeothamnion confervicola]